VTAIHRLSHVLHWSNDSMKREQPRTTPDGAISGFAVTPHYPKILPKGVFMAYHYQCAECYCTLCLETARNNEPVYSVINGDLCSSCQSQKDAEFYDDDDD